MEAENKKNSLCKGYLLHWYEIKTIIGRGGFGITYLAYDKNLDRDVAIKEFMPEDFAVRESNSTVHPKTGEQKNLYEWGLERFIKEAQTLAKFNHPNIVRVQSVFEQNNTAYMVMEYALGEDLSTVYKQRSKFTEEQFLDTFIPVLDGLVLVHNSGFIHRDIKPANIYICDDDSPLLLDFGSARESLGGKTKALTSLVTYGYAPYEQYNEGSGKQGPYTDIYSLGACIYTGITGEKPVDALQRGGSFLESGIDAYKPISIIAKGEYSDNFLLAVDNALMFKTCNRPQNIVDWADMLMGKTLAPKLPQDMFKLPEEEKSPLFQAIKETRPAAKISPSKGAQGLIHAHSNRSSKATGTLLLKDRQAATELFKRTDVPSTASSNFINVIFKKFGKTLPDTKKIWLPIVIGSVATVIIIFSFSEYFSDSTAPINSVQLPSKVTPPEELTQKLLPSKERLTQLSNKAELTFTQKKFITPEKDNALYFYQQILELEPYNKNAITGINNIEDELRNLANASYINEQYEKSLKYLAQLLFINPDSKSAASLQTKINKKQSRQPQIAILLKTATRQKNQSRYTSPKSDNAFDTYNKILKLAPSNKQALDGIKNIQWHYKSQFKRHISASQLSKAANDIEIMIKIAAPSSTISQMKKELKISKNILPPVKTASVKKTTNQLNINQVSKIIGQFKIAIEKHRKSELNKISQYQPGRKQFVDQLFSQYQNITVKVSQLNLIPKENKANTKIELTNLVDKNNVKVLPGSWNKFDITIRHSSNNQLKVHW